MDNTSRLCDLLNGPALFSSVPVPSFGGNQYKWNGRIASMSSRTGNLLTLSYLMSLPSVLSGNTAPRSSERL
eukprot:scaffold8974_cov148-Cylindrotheca_fusiformis.AAC.3